MQVHRMHPQPPPGPSGPAEAAGAHSARREGRFDPESVREKSLLRGETIRERMAWIEARRRELWERMDRLQARLGGGAPPAAASSGVLPAAPAGPPPELDPEARGSEVRLEQVRPRDEGEREAERQWLRDQVTAMRRDGWSWEELAGIGFGRELLADLGFELPAGEASRFEREPLVAETDAAG